MHATRPRRPRPRVVVAVVLAVVPLGCGADSSPPTARPRLGSREVTTVEVRDLAEHFTAEGVDGAFALYDPEGDRHVQYRPDRCGTRYPPGSTFGMLHAAIALESGVASGPGFPLPWGGPERQGGSEDRSLTLRAAVRGSVLWYFQELARRIGPERMGAWVQRAGYGNGEIGDGDDRFWLDGPLAISPNEQVDFLRRLHGGELPFSESTVATVRDLLVLEETPEYVLRGETGRAGSEGGAQILWLVGWVERGDARFYFATLILSGNPTRETADARLEVTHRILAILGAL